MSNTRLVPALQRGFRLSDIALVVTVTAIVGLMVMPVPLLLLDSLIAANILISITLLMMAAYVPSTLALSTFPALLMFTTLLRLSLNIASTKNILLHADAGHIIETFGRLVMGGNVVVGLVVFVIIAIVQFIVIAKGSERVAEVGARFSLDGMPGKQMSIDADLRAGNISKEEAKHKRELLEKESQMHGAMDGAMKFVKGDAIAGLVIAAVNILAGITVGMLLKNMEFSEAADRFVLLSIGDGMVSQIPSLFVSIASGVLITRVSNIGGHESDLSSDISRQVIAQPMALVFAGAIMLVFVIIPGFPKPVFLLLGLGVIGGGFLLRRRRGRPSNFHETPMTAFSRHGSNEVVPLISNESDTAVAPLTIAFSAEDAASISTTELDTAVAQARGRVLRALGLPFPGMRGRIDSAMPVGNVRFLVHEVPVLELSVQWGNEVAVPREWQEGSGAEMQIATAKLEWLQTGQTSTSESLVVTAEQLVGIGLRRVLTLQAEQFVGMQEVQRLLEESASVLPGLVEEVMRILPLQRIAEVMRRLVQEGISVRHQREILESLITWGPREKDIVMLTEYVRVDCGRATAFAHGRGRTLLPVLMVDASIENEIRSGIESSVAGTYLALNPDQTQKIIDAFNEAVAQSKLAKKDLIVVCSMDVRRYLQRILSQAEKIVPVLSFQELGSHIQLQAVAHLALDIQEI
jgi:type III secretion protein V